MNTAEDQSRGTIAILFDAGYFRDYVAALEHWLDHYGWQVSVMTTATLEATVGFDVVIVVGMSFFPFFPFRPQQIFVGFQSEQMPLSGDTDWSLFRNLRRYKGICRYYDLVMEWSPANFTRNPAPDQPGIDTPD